MAMLREQDRGLVWLRWPLLAGFPEVEHRIFTRHGGVSPAPYANLNLSYTVGDDPARVRRNRALVREAMGLAELISVGQVHGGNTLILTDRQAVAAAGEPRGIDILITNLPKIGLLIKQADCQAVVVYDPEHRVIANIHCGWRGNVQNVLGQAVRRLQEAFGSRPAALYAGISPSLGPCCAEFRNFRQEFPPEFWHYQVRPTYFDLWQLSVDQLVAVGLPRDHIQVAGLCSRCQAQDFFSYRRERLTGRNGTVVCLRDGKKAGA
jgi:YfiH family protein